MMSRLSELGDGDARFALVREHVDPIAVARFTIEGEPMVKARARFTKAGQTYSPAANREAEKKIAWLFRQASGGATADAEYSYGVVALFFASTRQRRDVDNMLKLILDGLNKVAWADDTQVSEISGRKELISDPEDARTEVAVYRLGPVPRRMGKCEHCGASFPEYRSQKGRRFCSTACDLERRRIARTKPCATCGEPFEGRPATRFCSVACKSAGMTVALTCIQCTAAYQLPQSQARGLALCSTGCRVAYWREHPPARRAGACATCGGPTSRKAYTRCRPCGLVVLTIVEVA